MSAIPDTDNVLRYCPPGTVVDGKPTHRSFEPRFHSGEHDLSVNWMEKASSEGQCEAVYQVREALGKKLKLRDKGRLAMVNVGNIRDVDDEIVVCPAPECKDPSHTLVKAPRFTILQWQEAATEILQRTEKVFATT